MFNHNLGIESIENNLFFINKNHSSSINPFDENKIDIFKDNNIKKVYLEKFYQNFFFYLKILPKHSQKEIENLTVHNYGAWYEDGRRIEQYSEYFPNNYFLMEFNNAISDFGKSYTIIHSLNDIYTTDRRQKEIRFIQKSTKKIKKDTAKTDVKTIITGKLKILSLKELNYILKENSIEDWSNKKNVKIDLIYENLSIEEIGAELNKIKSIKEKSKKIEELLNKFNITKLKSILNKVDSNVFNNALYFNYDSSEIISKIIQILPFDKFDSFIKSLIDLMKNPTCKVCGKKLDRWSKNETCRDCNKKIHACTVLINLRNLIGDLGFTKKDLEELGYNNIEANDAIWTLQTFDLIKKEGDIYYLEKEENLNKFEEEWGEHVDPEKIKNMTKIFSKVCKACGENKKVSEFAKSDKTIDNYNDFCKVCNKKILTAKNLKSILNYVKPLEEFSLSDLEKYYPEEFIRIGIIYNLQDNDLIQHKGEIYRLKEKSVLNEFLDKWGRFIDDKNETEYEDEIYRENLDYYIAKNTKYCEICGKEIKSQNNVCKTCKKNIHACKLLIDLIDEIDFEEAFNKEDLLSKGYNKMESMDLIWTLEESKLIKKEGNNYKLENISILESFIEEWETYI